MKVGTLCTHFLLWIYEVEADGDIEYDLLYKPVHFVVIYKVSVIIVSICFCKSSKKMHSMAKKGWERKGGGYEKQSQ